MLNIQQKYQNPSNTNTTSKQSNNTDAPKEDLTVILNIYTKSVIIFFFIIGFISIHVQGSHTCWPVMISNQVARWVPEGLDDMKQPILQLSPLLCQSHQSWMRAASTPHGSMSSLVDHQSSFGSMVQIKRTVGQGALQSQNKNVSRDYKSLCFAKFPGFANYIIPNCTF